MIDYSSFHLHYICFKADFRHSEDESFFDDTELAISVSLNGAKKKHSLYCTFCYLQ